MTQYNLISPEEHKQTVLQEPCLCNLAEISDRFIRMHTYKGMAKHRHHSSKVNIILLNKIKISMCNMQHLSKPEVQILNMFLCHSEIKKKQC